MGHSACHRRELARAGDGPSALLLGLERSLVDRRVRVLSYVLPEEEQLAEGLANAGFTRRPAVAYFDKVVSV